MNPARLRDKVILYGFESDPSPDTDGQYSEQRKRIDTLRADVQTVSGGESMQADRPEARAQYEVLVRDHPDLSEEKQFGWEGKTLTIERIRNHDRLRRGKVCECSWIEQ